MALPVLYTEIIGLDVSMVSSTLGLGDSVAALLSTVSGVLSDGCRSPWGKRKPFILTGTLLLVAGLLGNANPPGKQVISNKHGVCHDSSTNCSLMQACADTYVLLQRNSNSKPLTVTSPLTFLCFSASLLCYQVGKSLAVAPYAAMGQEMYSGTEARVALFSLRGFCAYVGILSRISLHLYLAYIFASDYALQMTILSFTAALCILICLVFTCLTPTKDMQSSHSREQAAISMVGTVRYSIINNHTYIHYAVMRSFFILGYLLPYLQISSFVKFVLHYENGPLAVLKFQLAMLFSALLCSSTVKRMAQKFGFQKCLSLAAIWGCILYAVVLALGDSLNTGIFVVGAAIAPLKVSFFSLFDSYVAVIIDYDQLKSGCRHEGIFVAMDQACLSLMLVIIIAVSGNLLSAVGYLGNGGCKCGCGKKCVLPFMRWSCPADEGYACSGLLEADNVLFYGDPNRPAACTFQSQAVVQFIELLFAGVPMVSFICSLVLIIFFPIKPNVYKEILSQLKVLLENGSTIFDPVANKLIIKLSPEDEARMNLRLVLSQLEVSRMSAAKDFKDWLAFFNARTLGAVIFIVATVFSTFILPPSLRGMNIFIIMGAVVATMWNIAKFLFVTSHISEFESLQKALVFQQSSKNDTRCTGRTLNKKMVCKALRWHQRIVLPVS